MKNEKQELENINAKLFSSFDPEEELWILGGQQDMEELAAGEKTVSGSVTGTPQGPDGGGDFDYKW